VPVASETHPVLSSD